MPVGVWSAKDERQYKSILKSCKARGRKAAGCKRMAAATVNKTRVRDGRAKKGCECPKGSRRMKTKRSHCYNPRTRKRHRLRCA